MLTAERSTSETGLYYYRARYYDPSAGRFVSEDPIRFKGGLNLYDYVTNSVVNWRDPYGLVKWKCSMASVTGGKFGLGLGGMLVICDSECDHWGHRLHQELLLVGGGLSVGLPVTLTGSDFTLTDPLDFAWESSLSSLGWTYVSGGASLGKGGAFGKLTIGSGSTGWAGGSEIGADASANAFGGFVFELSHSWRKCCK